MSKKIVKNTTESEGEIVESVIPRNKLGVNRYTTPEGKSALHSLQDYVNIFAEFNPTENLKAVEALYKRAQQGDVQAFALLAKLYGGFKEGIDITSGGKELKGITVTVKEFNKEETHG